MAPSRTVSRAALELDSSIAGEWQGTAAAQSHPAVAPGMRNALVRPAGFEFLIDQLLAAKDFHAGELHVEHGFGDRFILLVADTLRHEEARWRAIVPQKLQMISHTSRPPYFFIFAPYPQSSKTAVGSNGARHIH